MQFTTTRFGEISYSTEDIISFPKGLVGFPTLNEFVLVEHKPDTPFRWLQSTVDAGTAFLVVDPSAFVQDYSPVVNEVDAEELSGRASYHGVDTDRQARRNDFELSRPVGGQC
jgi:flagellar assembly factor FliW